MMGTEYREAATRATNRTSSRPVLRNKFRQEVNAFSVGMILDSKFFRDTIAGRGGNIQADNVPVSEPVTVAGGEIAINAVANLISGADHANSFDNLHGGVAVHANIAVEIQNAFGLCAGGYRPQSSAQRHEDSAEGRRSEVHILFR